MYLIKYWRKSEALVNWEVNVSFLYEKRICFPDNFLSIDDKKGEFRRGAEIRNL